MEIGAGEIGRDVLVASSQAVIRSMIVNDRAMFVSGDDITLREFRLPECQENPTQYGEEESHMGAGQRPACADSAPTPADPFLSTVTVLGCYKDHVFTGGTDSVIKVWDRTSWQCLLTIEGHTGTVTGLVGMACLPELPEPYETIVSSGSDGTVRVWHVVNRQAASPGGLLPEEKAKQSEIEKKAATALADPNCPEEAKTRVNALLESLKKHERDRSSGSGSSSGSGMTARCVCVHQFGTPVTCLVGMGSHSTKVVCGLAEGSAHCLDCEIHDARGIIQTYEHDGLWESLSDPVCVAVTPLEGDAGGITVVADHRGLLCAWGALTGDAMACAKLDQPATAMCSLGPESVVVGTASGSVYLWQCNSRGLPQQGLRCLTVLPAGVVALVTLVGKDAMGYSTRKLYAGCQAGGVYLVGTEKKLSELGRREALYDLGFCGEEQGVVEFITEVSFPRWGGRRWLSPALSRMCLTRS